MMTATRLGADSAHCNSNIVKLPTAARRQVQQRSAPAVRAYRAENPWPGEFLWPAEREAQRRKEGAKRSPELLMIICLAKVLTPDQRAEFKRLVNVTHLYAEDEHTRAAAWLCDLI